MKGEVMGEMADYDIEEGQERLQLHLNGDCDTEDPCEYCEQEERLWQKYLRFQSEEAQ